MRRPLVAGNWKMNGTLSSIAPLVAGIKRGVTAAEPAGVKIVVCPAFVYLPYVADALADTPVGVGAQNLCEQESGAYTGEVSGAMLTDYRCRFVIVGHSERRHIYGEDNALVAQKVATALHFGVTPILCVGELLEQRESGQTEQVIESQLRVVIEHQSAMIFADTVIAYEPVWAIGTGKTATPEQAQEVHAFIRRLISKHDTATAARARILYGGSVKASNAAELFNMQDIDGGLIGGASLDAEEFLTICRAAKPPQE